MYESELAIRAAREGSRLTLEVSGELDMANAPGLYDELVRAQDSDAEQIILDLRGLDFTDAWGLRVMVLASQRAGRDSHRLRIIRGTGLVSRVMQITGVHRVLALAD